MKIYQTVIPAETPRNVLVSYLMYVYRLNVDLPSFFLNKNSRIYKARKHHIFLNKSTDVIGPISVNRLMDNILVSYSLKIYIFTFVDGNTKEVTSESWRETKCSEANTEQVHQTKQRRCHKW